MYSSEFSLISQSQIRTNDITIIAYWRILEVKNVLAKLTSAACVAGWFR